MLVSSDPAPIRSDTPATLSGLDVHVTALVRSVSAMDTGAIVTDAQCLTASTSLGSVQRLRKFITGVYGDAKRPLVAARRKLDAQQRGLLDPLEKVERSLTAAILGFQSSRQAELSASDTPVAIQAPALAIGMSARTTVRAEVDDVQQLVLSVAAQMMLEGAKGVDGTTCLPLTASTRRWLQAFQPTPQATLSLLRPDPTVVNALARALRDDLALPGVRLVAATTLVDRR